MCTQCLRTKELDAAESDRLRCGSEIAPDRRRCGPGAQGKAEAFNRERPVVANLVHRGKELLPCDVPGTRSAPIVFTRAQTLEMARHNLQRRQWIALRCWREKCPAGFRSPRPRSHHTASSHRRLCEEIRFESVQRLERDFDTGGMDHGREAVQLSTVHFHSLEFAGGRSGSRPVCNRPAKNRHAVSLATAMHASRCLTAC